MEVVDAAAASNTKKTKGRAPKSGTTINGVKKAVKDKTEVKDDGSSSTESSPVKSAPVNGSSSAAASSTTNSLTTTKSGRGRKRGAVDAPQQPQTKKVKGGLCFSVKS